jgi:hypothetical protein
MYPIDPKAAMDVECNQNAMCIGSRLKLNVMGSWNADHVIQMAYCLSIDIIFTLSTALLNFALLLRPIAQKTKCTLSDASS